MLKFELVIGCVAGLNACLWVFGVEWRVINFAGVPWCVAWMTASRGAPLGRRASECVAVCRVLGLECG